MIVNCDDIVSSWIRRNCFFLFYFMGYSKREGTVTYHSRQYYSQRSLSYQRSDRALDHDCKHVLYCFTLASAVYVEERRVVQGITQSVLRFLILTSNSSLSNSFVQELTWYTLSPVQNWSNLGHTTPSSFFPLYYELCSFKLSGSSMHLEWKWTWFWTSRTNDFSSEDVRRDSLPLDLILRSTGKNLGQYIITPHEQVTWRTYWVKHAQVVKWVNHLWANWSLRKSSNNSAKQIRYYYYIHCFLV